MFFFVFCFFIPGLVVCPSATYTQTGLSTASKTPIQWILHVYHDFNIIWSNLCVWNVGGLAQSMVRGRHLTREVYTQSPRPWIQQACALFKICVCIAITELVSTLHMRYANSRPCLPTWINTSMCRGVHTSVITQNWPFLTLDLAAIHFFNLLKALVLVGRSLEASLQARFSSTLLLPISLMLYDVMFT